MYIWCYLKSLFKWIAWIIFTGRKIQYSKSLYMKLSGWSDRGENPLHDFSKKIFAFKSVKFRWIHLSTFDLGHLFSYFIISWAQAPTIFKVKRAARDFWSVMKNKSLLDDPAKCNTWLIIFFPRLAGSLNVSLTS